MNSTIKAILIASAMGVLSPLQATTGSKTIPGDFPGNPKNPLVLCALRLEQLQAEQQEAAIQSYRLCQTIKQHKQALISEQNKQRLAATRTPSSPQQAALINRINNLIGKTIDGIQRQIQTGERSKALCEHKQMELENAVCDLRERQQLASIARGLPLTSFEYEDQDDPAMPAPALPPRPATVRQRTISREEPGQTQQRPTQRQRVV